MKLAVFLLAALIGAGSASGAAAVDQRSVKGGFVVNFGTVSAEQALLPHGHPDQHPLNPPSGSQHLMITLDEEKTGKRIGDAEVVMEVTDPRGGVERKELLHTQSGGMADYSELCVFGWSGRSSVRVLITPRTGGTPWIKSCGNARELSSWISTFPTWMGSRLLGGFLTLTVRTGLASSW